MRRPGLPHHSHSPDSDSAANGVAESWVRFLKRRARILLDSAGVKKEHWPTAVQYAAAQQLRGQLGVLFPMRVAYGTKVYVLQGRCCRRLWPRLDQISQKAMSY